MNLSIVGLDVLGTSLALALRAVATDVTITGHDPASERVARAKKLGAIDMSHWNLISSCDHADLVVLNVPLDALEHTMTALGREITHPTVMLDLAPVKRPVLEWARRLLPETTCFIGAHVVLPQVVSEDTQPSSELLKGATFYIVAPESASASAVDTVSNLSLAVGAIPRYIDAVEHDGLVAAAVQLPAAAALALLHAVTASAGREDRLTACGSEFLGLCALLFDAPGMVVDVILANADNVLPWLERYGLELDALRQIIATGDREALMKLWTAIEPVCRSRVHKPPEQSPDQLVDEQRINWLRDMFVGRMGWRKRR